MRLYSMGKAGKRALRDCSGSVESEEMVILEYLGQHKSATDDQLEVIGGERWLLRHMVERGLLKELTN